MALTNSFPTGLPAGLSIIDTRKTVAGLIAQNAVGAPRLGVLSSSTPQLVAATTSMSYTVAAASFATSRTGQGVELVANDGTVTIATTAAPASNSRMDVIWVRARFTASGDASGAPEINVTQGAASGTVPPPKPSIPAGALELATAQIPSTATATNSSGVIITQTHQFTAASGGVVPFRSNAERDAWIPPSGQYGAVGNQLFVSNGSTWVIASTRRLGNARRNTDLVIAGPGAVWTDLLAVSATTTGGLCVADFKAKYRNGNSGAFRSAKFRVLCDGVQIGDIVEFSAPLDAVATGYSAAFDMESTPTAGTHTWVLQGQASTASAVFVSNGVMTVTEN
ncbi:hypothetical protein [Plantibacter sp. YIM 135249]|uniref:hypothetical protein n=1 Tax=Plantibacter sp. YIM 135249 TaxID=3423918 RepID=UPI003D3508C8